MTEMIEEHGHDEIHLPGPTYWPLVLALGLLVLVYGLAMAPLRAFLVPVGGVVVAVGMGGWLMRNIHERARLPASGLEVPKMGMWMFLGSEVLFFTGLIAVFLLMRARSPADVGHVLDVPVTALNTFILLTSSLTVVLSLDAAHKGRQGLIRFFLVATAVLGTIFVSIQGYEYTKLYAEGLTLGSSGYGTSFFTLTGFHGTHVIIGIVWCLVVLGRALAGGFNQKEYGGIEIFGLYWHFVDIVWILLFTLIYLMQ